MHRTWWMPGPDAGLSVMVNGPRRTAEDAVPHRVSTADLACWLADPADRTKVFEMYEAVTGSSPLASPGVFEPDLQDCVRRALERAFRQTRLVAVRNRRTQGTGPAEFQGTGPRNAQAPTAAATPADHDGTAAREGHRQAAPSRTWIEVVLVDAQGRPVAGERCRLKLPDGSVRTERLDAGGCLRVDGIDPGTCEVSFPDRDGAEWRAA